MGAYNQRTIFKDSNFDFTYEVDFQIYSFKEYLIITERYIEIEIEEKIKNYENILKQANQNEIEQYFQKDFEDHEIKKLTRQLYYNALFISLYSLLERKMYQICRLAEDAQSLKIRDMSGEGIEKYHKYIKKVLKINLDEVNEEWTEIKNYNKLRNKMVHSSSYSIENIKQNERFISTLKSIKNLKLIHKDDHVHFEIHDKKLLIEFCSTINRFLYFVFYDKSH